MKKLIIHTEAELKDALRKALDRSIFRIVGSEERRGHRVVDLSIEASIGGRTATFVTECKLNPTISALDQVKSYATGKRFPLLATVRLSESFVEECRQRGISCLDINGRIWIKAPGLLIDRQVPSSSARYTLAESGSRFFAPKSSRLARTLLHSPERTWRQSDLAGTTGLSQGLLSRLLNHAARQGWVEGRRGDWKLAGLSALLDAWQREDDFSKRVILRQYSTLETNRHSTARQLIERWQGELAFTQWFAASLRHPYADVAIVSAYRREFPAPEELADLGFREVDSGGRVFILIPRDDGVFRNIQLVEGIPLVTDAQIYLDLIHAGLRGPDQAKALREWKGFCKS